jgi:hypothetical protein
MTVRLIAFTVVALSIVNAYSFVRLYSATYLVADRAPLQKSNRQPASIPQTTATPMASSDSRLSLDLNCSGKKQRPLKISGQWALLRGRVCQFENFKAVEIVNLQNGFTASVFNIGVQQYQTDLIQLDQGTNKVRVRLIPLKGSIEEQTFVIESNPI